MRHLITFTAAIFIALVTAQAAQAQADMNGPGYWQCQSYMGNTNTIYFSAVFEGTADQPVAPAFDQMLGDKYGFKGGGSCGIAWKTGITMEKLQADAKTASSQLSASGKKVIETGWTFSPGAPIRYWCKGIVRVSGQGQIKNYSYATSIFDVPGTAVKALTGKWNGYLKSQHSGGQVNLANCTAAQADESKTLTQINSFSAQYASQAEVVHSDWEGE
jgi:hypothetical protein